MDCRSPFHVISPIVVGESNLADGYSRWVRSLFSGRCDGESPLVTVDEDDHVLLGCAT